jgi:hypothetical protein
MPAKRIRAKRRLGPAAEAEAWAELFSCGDDWFGDLEPLGFQGGDAHADPATRAAALEAWQRLGELYMRDIWPRDRHHKPCWALEQFGPPKG